MNYTKREWEVIGPITVKLPNKHSIYTATLPLDSNQFEEAKANANLIAAAPDMYEALKETINAEDSIPEYMAKIINKALAKAAGKERNER